MIAALIIYTQFFTRIPLAKSVDLSHLKKGIAYLPFFGLLIGLIEAIVYQLLACFFPSSLAWMLTLFFDVLLTGGFHLDALADMADGLFSSRSKERSLEIMKDSRIGSNGVLALIFYYGLLLLIFPHLPKPSWQVVVGLGMIGKVGLTLQTYDLVYAKASGGSGQLFQGCRSRDIALGQCLPIILLYLAFAWRALLAYALVVFGAVCYRHFVYGKIDGHTGDTLGAFVEIAQLLYLLGLVL